MLVLLLLLLLRLLLLKLLNNLGDSKLFSSLQARAHQESDSIQMVQLLGTKVYV